MGWCNGGNHGDAVHVETASLDRNCRRACAEIYKVKKNSSLRLIHRDRRHFSVCIYSPGIKSTRKIDRDVVRLDLDFQFIFIVSFVLLSFIFFFFFFGVRMEIELSTEIEIPSIMSFVKAHCADSGSQNLYGWK